MTGGEPPIVWPEFLETSIRRLREAGLDIVHPFSVKKAQNILGAEVQFPHVKAAYPLGLIIGNTRALWAPFVTSREATQTDPPLSDPLDTYVERIIQDAFLLSRREFQVAYSHTLLPAPIPLQRMADAAGVAHLGPAHLSIHPTYGPWFALRAVVVIDFPPSADLRLSVQPTQNLCQGCAAPCTLALAEARQHHSEPPLPKHVQLAASPLRLSKHAQAWARIRQVCPLGQEYQFSAPQLKYHYDKSRVALFADNIRRLRPEP